MNELKNLTIVFQNSKFVERMVIMVSIRTALQTPAPDSLVIMRNIN